MTRPFEIAIAILVIAAFLLSRCAEAAEPPPEPCNCVAYAIAALRTVGIRLKIIPSIGVNDWHKHKGDYSRHVVHIRDINDCRTMIHEFVHEYQYERDGDGLDYHEWHRREMKAAMLTMHAEAEMGLCK